MVQHQSVLRRLIVIWRHQQGSLGTTFFRAFGELDGFGGGIGAGAGNHRQALINNLVAARQQIAMLRRAQRGRFPGGTGNDQRVRALLDMKVDQGFQRRVINVAITEHGGGQGH